MATAGFTTDGNSGTGIKFFFCYKCNRTINLNPCPTSDPQCPHCNEGFLEECENPIADSDHHPPSFFPLVDPFSSILPLVFYSAPTSVDLQNPSLFSSVSSGGRDRADYPDPDVFDPFFFLQNHLQNLRSGGARIQFVVENDPSESGNRIPADFGDYFIGPGLEQLIQQLAENDPNRYGPPPASKSAIEMLPTLVVTDELSTSEMNQCAVCMDVFEKGTKVKQMPCKHLYHQDCILPWLELHNSCPVCRHELPTDDAEYEDQRQVQQGNSSGNGSSGQENRTTTTTTERRFRISLPWPFRRYGSSSDLESGEGSTR